MTMFTTTDKLREARREVAQRKRVYPRLVEKGSLTREAADRQTAIMQAIVEDYERQAQAEESQGRLI